MSISTREALNVNTNVFSTVAEVDDAIRSFLLSFAHALYGVA